MELVQLKERADAYVGLLAHPGWVRLMGEMTELIEAKKENIVNDLVNDRFEDRAIVWGMRIALNTPNDAIREYEQHNQEDSEPSI